MRAVGSGAVSTTAGGVAAAVAVQLGGGGEGAVRAGDAHAGAVTLSLSGDGGGGATPSPNGTPQLSCLYVGCPASRDHGLALWVCSVPSGLGPGAVRF